MFEKWKNILTVGLPVSYTHLNEALRQQILALEAERDNLTKENKDLTEENAALDDTAPESGDDEANPIDRFFEGVDVGSSTAEMNAVADSWAGACLLYTSHLRITAAAGT